MSATRVLAEERESLWRLTASPLVWAAHFLFSYGAASIWCARFAGRDGSLGGLRTAIALATLAALACIFWVGRDGLRRHRFGAAPHSHAFDADEDRHRFLGYATLLLSALSAVAVIFGGLVIVFIKDCR